MADPPVIKKKPTNLGIGPSNVPKLPEKYPTGAGIGEHPAGIPESFIERQIKSKGGQYGTLVPGDFGYLEQYLHPEYDVLERQKLRPTVRGGGTDNLEWYRPPTEHENIFDPTELENVNKLPQGPEKEKQYLGLKKTYPVNTLDLAGLGNFTESRGNPSYDSIYDKWDFDTKSPLIRGPAGILDFPQSIIGSFLEHVGKPFHVYEREPKNAYGMIPEGEEIQPFSNRGRDINLPSPGFVKPKPKVEPMGMSPSEAAMLGGKIGGMIGTEPIHAIEYPKKKK